MHSMSSQAVPFAASPGVTSSGQKYGATPQKTKRFMASWGYMHWTGMALCAFLALGAAAVAAAYAMTSQKGPMTNVVVGGCICLSIFFLPMAFGINSPTAVTLESTGTGWNLVLQRRGRACISRPVTDLIGLADGGQFVGRPGASFYSTHTDVLDFFLLLIALPYWLCSKDAGHATGSPSWMLNFEDDTYWFFTLQEHKGFRQMLVDICQSSGQFLRDVC